MVFFTSPYEGPEEGRGDLYWSLSTEEGNPPSVEVAFLRSVASVGRQSLGSARLEPGAEIPTSLELEDGRVRQVPERVREKCRQVFELIEAASSQVPASAPIEEVYIRSWAVKDLLSFEILEWTPKGIRCKLAGRGFSERLEFETAGGAIGLDLAQFPGEDFFLRRRVMIEEVALEWLVPWRGTVIISVPARPEARVLEIEWWRRGQITLYDGVYAMGRQVWATRTLPWSELSDVAYRLLKEEGARRKAIETRAWLLLIALGKPEADVPERLREIYGRVDDAWLPGVKRVWYDQMYGVDTIYALEGTPLPEEGYEVEIVWLDPDDEVSPYDFSDEEFLRTLTEMAREGTLRK